MRKSPFPNGFACAIAALLCSPHTPSAADLYWVTVPVDTACYGASTVAVDGDGNLKVAYRAAHEVNYAVWKDGRWNTELADTGLAGEAQLDMALDADGNPHVVHHDGSYRNGIYVRKEGKSWKRIVEIPINIVNTDYYQSSIKVNSAGDAFLAFAVLDKGWAAISVTKVAKNGTVTGPTVVDRGSGKWNNMKLDKAGNPLLAFYRTDAGTQTALAYMEGADWKMDIVDSGKYPTSPGHYPNVVSDTDGTVYVSYLNSVSEKPWLYLSTGKPGGPWKISAIDSLPASTLYSCRNSLAIDNKGRLYIAYPLFTMNKEYQVAASKLILAYKDKGDSVWHKQVIDSSGIAGEFVSLAISKEQTPILTYLHSDSHKLWSAISSYSPIVVAGVARRAPAFRIPALSGWFSVDGRRLARPPERWLASGVGFSAGEDANIRRK